MLTLMVVNMTHVEIVSDGCLHSYFATGTMNSVVFADYVFDEVADTTVPALEWRWHSTENNNGKLFIRNNCKSIL